MLIPTQSPNARTKYRKVVEQFPNKKENTGYPKRLGSLAKVIANVGKLVSICYKFQIYSCSEVNSAFLKFQCKIHRLFNEWPVPLIRQLNTTTRMPVKIFFVMLIGDIIFPFALGIQCLHENGETAKYSGSCI